MLIDQYLNYLNEIKIPKWIKDTGTFVRDLYFEPVECKLERNKNKFMYLFHGTRPKYVNSIRKNGLKVSMAGQRSKEEDDINWSMGKEEVWFSTIYNRKKAGFGHNPKKEKVIIMIAKVNPKYLKANGSTYTYNKDIPPKDIIWGNDPRFYSIPKNSKCLRII